MVVHGTHIEEQILEQERSDCAKISSSSNYYHTTAQIHNILHGGQRCKEMMLRQRSKTKIAPHELEIQQRNLIALVCLFGAH